MKNLPDDESLEHLRLASALYDFTPHLHLVDLSIKLLHKVTAFPFVGYVPRHRFLRIMFCRQHQKTTRLLDSSIDIVRQNCNKALHQTRLIRLEVNL